MDFPSRITCVDNLQIAYRVAGEGPDIIFIHGWVSSSRMWKLLIDELSPRYRCWAIDLPGFAESGKPHSSWYSIENYEKIVTHFADQFDLQQFDVMGHSMGGMIALRLGAIQPQRVRRLVVINPIVTGRIYLDIRFLTNTPLSHSVLTLGRWFWPIASSDLLRRHQADHTRRMSDEWNQATPESAVSAAKALSQHNLTPLLPKVVAPTLVILGTHDLAAPNSEGRLAAKMISNARLKTLTAGHLPTDDVPEQVNELVNNFLNEESVLA